MAQKKSPSPSKQQLVSRLEAMQEIAVDLLKEKQPRKLLDLIVKKAVTLLESDAGSLYLKGEGDTLVYEVCHNQSLDYPFERKHIPLSSQGIANYCFNSCQPLRIDDVYSLSENLPFSFDSDSDTLIGYRTKSVLAYPLYNSKQEVLGVIQIINRKKKCEQEWPIDNEKELAKMPGFTLEDENLLKSFASLASAALENAGLYKEINNLLEGFVKASVKAIESRDLTTSGHSERVAVLTCGLAENVSRSNVQELRSYHLTDTQLKELRYASLLHDFGKICIKEKVILKAEKLYPEMKKGIEARMKEFAHVGEINYLRGFIDNLVKENRAPTEMEVARVRKDISKYREEVESKWEEILFLNKTSILDEDNSALLKKLRSQSLPLLDGQKYPLLVEDEVDFLSIKRGSITDDERDEINMHVTHTYHFLKEIPWTGEFKDLVDIAYAHHEKLDGSGYPRGLKQEDIPFQSQIMTVSDIFDALVAWDRPYKKAIPFERALDILQIEAREKKLNPHFVDLFIESKVYEEPEFVELMQASTLDKKAA